MNKFVNCTASRSQGWATTEGVNGGRSVLAMVLRGHGLVRFGGPSQNIYEAVELIKGHIQKHGFRGWRSFNDIVVNMSDLQAAWSENDREDAGDD